MALDSSAVTKTENELSLGGVEVFLQVLAKKRGLTGKNILNNLILRNLFHGSSRPHWYCGLFGPINERAKRFLGIFLVLAWACFLPRLCGAYDLSTSKYLTNVLLVGVVVLIFY